MTETATTDGPEQPAPAERAAEVEERLPLRDLDRAMAPVRRMVAWALSPRGRPSPYLGANLRPHAARALGLALPEALLSPLAEMDAALARLDAAEDPRVVLSEVYSLLARVDALAGLPMRASFRPVHKPRRVQVEEPPPAPPPAPAPVAEAGTQATAPAPRAEAPAPTPAPRAETQAPAPTPSTPVERVEEEDEEEDEGPTEFAGDLGHALVDLVGCPPALASGLAAAGVETVRDLAWLRPSRIEDLGSVHGAGRDLPEGLERGAVGGRIASHWKVLLPDGSAQRWSRVRGAGPMAVRWSSVAAPVDIGQKVVVAGTVVGHGEGAVLVDAECVTADDHVARLVCWGLADTDDGEMRALWATLQPQLGQVRDPLHPDALARAGGLSTLGAALVEAQIQGAEPGRRRMAFDEALMVQLAGILPRLQPGRDRGLGHTILHEHVARLGQTMDMVLGDSAQAALEDIKRDIRRSFPMRRVLVSEVGAGRGRVALLAAVIATESKSQVLVIGSDATDAENRFLHAEPVLRELGLVGRILGPGGVGGAQRDAIRRGEVHVVFCAADTLATQEPLEFRRLGLAIAFEREPWGAAAVWHAALPAPRPHLLVVPVVPVGPRVLSTAYADFHLSVVRQEGRRPARIALCPASERVTAYHQIREAVERGDQGVVVFPMVDGRDALEIPEALRVVRALEGDALRGLKVGLLHGAMPREEQARVHEDFSHRRISVLVSTTRVEDAPSVPGAAVVVVEQADRVEQWRLHRIIGYFSRSVRPARAILVVGENAEADAAARIDRVVSAPDGFRLTESLVQLRGTDRCVVPGSTPPASWRWFEPDVDLDLLLAARDEAHRMLRADPGLRRAGHADIAQHLRARWGSFWPDAEELGWACLLQKDAAVEPRRKRRRRRRKR
ncbi:MAG: hypothetical protein H6738_15815 [Alphaproteobacteria bacterium]|nr:hypothetical protein [Alphaproteobacteria bacterium]